MESTAPACLPSNQDEHPTSRSPTGATLATVLGSSSTMPAADRPKRSVKSVQPTSTAGITTKTTKASTIKGSWAASKILTPSSAIISPSVDIHAFLVTCISGFDGYTEDEKRGIIDSLPASYRQYNLDESGKLLCPITTDCVLSDSFVKRGVSKFVNDVEEGYYDPAWQTRARKAMQERREGKFDEYSKQHVEEMFGDGTASQQGSSKDSDNADGAEKGGDDGKGFDQFRASTTDAVGDEDGESGILSSSDEEWAENKRKSRKTKR